MTYATIALDENWDWTIDKNGNIDTKTGGAAVAQDVASACATFLGEVYYNDKLGIPYQTEILGKAFSSAYLSGKLEAEARRIEPVTDAVASVFFDSVTRRVSAKIMTQTGDGETQEILL
ncbi:hypothetical protein ABMZ87_17775 [Morganella morganii]|uniref:hypothetical protein n=1 Tax=Morganella morganii TaxID=582 RepID=UPI0034E4E8AA